MGKKYRYLGSCVKDREIELIKNKIRIALERDGEIRIKNI